MPSDSTVALADTVADLMRGAAGWLSLLSGTVALAVGVGSLVAFGPQGAPAVLAVVGALLLALGLAVNARFRRRLDRRRPVTTFGTVRSVDQRAVPPEADLDARCVACDDRVGEGLQRRFREEYAVAGVPVATRSERFNHYCLDCALAELDLDLDADGSPDGATGEEEPQDGRAGEQSLVESESSG